MNYQVTAVGGWNLIERLGEGNYGTVYLAKRTLGTYTEEAAIKHISIPENEAELNAIREEHGPEESSVLSCLDEIRDQIVGEYQQMHLLQGHTNIVACHDIECCPKQDGPGYDIYIRMELLESVSSRITAGRMNCEETIKLGMDICRALMLLSQQEPGIIHRDIKPQNLFVNANGDYKLGDFGTARSIAGTSALMSVKGTYAYMAPEVLNNQPVSFAADIYSLGLVMYRLMNENRAPFVNQGQGGSIAGSEASNMKRLQGVQLPAPAKADRELAGIILKACAFEPRDRWQSAEEMLSALEMLAEKTVQRNNTGLGHDRVIEANRTTPMQESKNQKKRNSKRIKHIAAIGVWAAILLAAVLWCGINYSDIAMWYAELLGNNDASDSVQSEQPTNMVIGDYIIVAGSDGTCRITGYTGSASMLYIPAVIGEYRVTELGPWAFYKCASIESVVVPDSVINIDDGAFEWCTSLKTVFIPESVSRIGEYAFCNCSSLSDITIPSSVSSIGKSAFVSCSMLEQITIPAGVLTIGEGAFASCQTLSEISVANENANYYSQNGVLFSQTGAILCYPAGKTSDKYDIPYGTTGIATSAFYGCRRLKSITLPNGITYINDYAFYDCRLLETIAVPEGVVSIGTQTFEQCLSLHTVLLPGSLLSIGNLAFDDCGRLRNINLPNGLVEIGNRVFEDCNSLVSVHIPQSVLTIGTNPFAYCNSLTDISVAPQNPVYTAVDGALINHVTGELICYLCARKQESFSVPEGVRSIGRDAFDRCSALVSIDLPVGLQSIYGAAFRDCTNLVSINIPDSVTLIDTEAFYNCSALTEITIPESVKHIGTGAFYNCVCLKSIELQSGLEMIGDWAFQKCRSLLSITIPYGVHEIGAGAFHSCSALSSVSIPNSIVLIGEQAFYDCDSLASIYIPESVTTIGDMVFATCAILKEINVSSDNECYYSIDNVLFSNAGELLCYPSGLNGEHYRVPDGITIIGKEAFHSSRLKYIVLPEGVTRLSDRAFYWSVLLEYVEMPSSITTIGDHTFWACEKLKELTIPISVDSIGEAALWNCPNLKVIVEENSLAQQYVIDNGVPHISR